MNRVVLLSSSILLFALSLLLLILSSTVPLNPPVIIEFSINPSAINTNSTSTLLWNVTGATTVSIDQGIGQVNAAGSKVLSPATSTIYTISATNSDGTVTKSVTTTVNLPPSIAKPAPTLHTISLKEIDSNPVYWNLAWQSKYSEMEKKVREINQLYFRTHTYIEGQTDCNDMAIDIWNMLKTAGITSIIVAGNLDLDNYNFSQCNHAWLLINEKRDKNVPAAFALEATNGQLYTGSTTNKHYWAGFLYINPSDLKLDLGTRW